MIKKLVVEDIDDLSELINDFLQFMQERYGQPAPDIPLKDQFQDALSENTRVVFAVYNQDGKPVGMAVGNPAAHWITLFYVQNMLSSSRDSETFVYEKELFEAVFAHLKESSPTITSTRDFSEPLGTYIVDLGFQRLERARMSISRSEVEELKEPALPPEFAFAAWNKGMTESLIKVLGQAHFDANHVDGSVFPQFAGNNGFRFLLEGIENSTYGAFKEEFPRVLTHKGKPIGICFLTIVSSNTGYIPEIVIPPAYRGRRLGKALIVHSLKHFIDREPEIPKVDLDVTLANTPAAALYRSLGFQEKQRYFLSVWRKNE